MGGRGTGLRALIASALGPGALAHAALGLLILTCLAIPLAHAVRVEPLVPTICGFALVMAASRIRLGDRRAGLLIIVCSAVFVLVQVFICLNHITEPYSDFRTQWLTAIEYAEHGLGVPDRPQTQRAIPLYYVLASLFGPRAAVYQVANVAITTLTYLMAVWIARRYFGWPAAARTAILLLLAFEAYFANTIPTHEIPGAFGVVLFLLLLAEMEQAFLSVRDQRRLVVAVAGLGVTMALTIAWTHWQRDIGVFSAFALLLYGTLAVIRRAPRARLRLWITALVLVLSVLAFSLLKEAGLVADPPPTHFTSMETNLVAFSEYDTDGRFADKKRKHRLLSAMQPEAAARLARAMFPETVRTGAADKYENLLTRDLRFLRFGQDSRWYFRETRSPRWLSIETLTAIYDGASRYVRPIWWAILLIVSLAALFRRDVILDHRLSPLLLILAFLATMGALGEAQSRYAFFVVYLASIYAGAPWLLDPLRAPDASSPDRPTPRAISLRAACVAIACVAVVAVAVLLLRIAPRIHEVALANFERSKVGAAGKAPIWFARARRKLVRATQTQMTIGETSSELQPLTVTVSQDLRAREAPEGTLRFVIENANSVGSEPLRAPGRSLRVVIDGKLVETIDLAAGFLPRAVAVSGIGEGLHRVRLELDVRDIAEQEGRATTTIAYLGFY
jgi:hypothetical protein